jgi:hypothetical protein
MMIDLARLSSGGIRPIIERSALNPAECGVEFRIADEEGVMLRRNGPVLLVIIEGDAVREVDHQEMKERPRGRKAENIGEEVGRQLLVVAPDDRVVQLRHQSFSFDCSNSHWRIAEVRFGGRSASSRAASISATSAFTGQPRFLAAPSNAFQNMGSRLIEVWCPAMSTERLVGGA